MRAHSNSLTATIVAFALTSSCSAKGNPRPILTPALSAEAIKARLDEAGALAARGCYLCLKDAAVAYSNLNRAVGNAFTLDEQAWQNDVMLAIREIELRISDSDVRERTERLRQHLRDNDERLLSLFDLFATWYESRAIPEEYLRARATRTMLLATLKDRWRSSITAAYIHLAVGFESAEFADVKAAAQSVVDQHPQYLGLKYRLIATPSTFDPAAATQLLTDEPRFAEIHLIMGQQAMFRADLIAARRELLAAYKILPESLSIKSSLAAVEFALAHYAQALTLLDDILAISLDPSTNLTRAEVLSYLKRHTEAIVALDQLLTDPSHNPGEKYYWRAWNKLQLQDLESAYQDATTALRFMSGVDAYRLAGITSFNVSRLSEARGHFESALTIAGTDCDSIQYLGQLDAAEGKWSSAATRFTHAASCFESSIERKRTDLVKKEAEDASGILDSQISSLKAEIEAGQQLQRHSLQNASIARRNFPPGH